MDLTGERTLRRWRAVVVVIVVGHVRSEAVGASVHADGRQILGFRLAGNAVRRQIQVRMTGVIAGRW